MTKIIYDPYRPQGTTSDVVEASQTILREYMQQGYSITLRQLFYQFIARDLFPNEWIDPSYNKKHGLPADTKNTIKNYKRLSVVVKRAREGGLIDWEGMVDRTRNMVGNPIYDSPAGMVSQMSESYFVDLWKGQPYRVEVWVEKDAMSQIVETACSPLGVDFFANRGYVSASTIWDIAHNRHKVAWDEFGQKTIVLHLGDHDPSGIDMTRDIEERVRLYASPYYEAQKPPDITFVRLGLNMDQIKELNPPSDPAKVSDPRAGEYVEKYGERSWELDALEPSYIICLLYTSPSPRDRQKSRMPSSA